MSSIQSIFQRTIALTLLLWLSTTAQAAAVSPLTVYTDQASFLNATGPVQAETFNALTVDQPANNLDLGAFTAHNSISVDAPNLSYSVDGTSNLFVNTTYTWADLVFDRPVVAFGAWFAGMNPTGRPYSSIRIDAAGLAGYGSYSHLGSYLPPTAPVGTLQFIGFTSSQAFNRIVFEGALCCSSSFAIDNVVYTEALAPVPEPETYALLLAGLGLMGAVVRRQNRMGTNRALD